jgi:hypothetical protein
MRRIGVFSVSSLLLAGVTLLPTGCVGVGSASVSASQESSASTVASQSVGSWQSQALRLGKALHDIENAVPSIPEPPAGEKPEGTYSALIVGVDAVKRTVTIDRCQTPTGEDAAGLAKQADSPQEAPHVVNQRKEQIAVPVAQDASFVVFYPGEGAMNVSLEGYAARSALSFDQFVEFYRTHGEVLSNRGGWVTITEGQVTSFVEPVDGTS